MRQTLSNRGRTTAAHAAILREYRDLCRESTMTPPEAYQRLIQLYREARLLESISSLIGWDERTYMPVKGSAHRAEQMALVARLVHEQLTAPVLGELLAAVERSPLVAAAESVEAVNVREIRRVY